MVYVGRSLFLSYEIPTSVGEILWSLGCDMGPYLDIAQ